MELQLEFAEGPPIFIHKAKFAIVTKGYEIIEIAPRHTFIPLNLYECVKADAGIVRPLRLSLFLAFSIVSLHAAFRKFLLLRFFAFRLNSSRGVITDGPGRYVPYQTCSWIIGNGQYVVVAVVVIFVVFYLVWRRRRV